MKCAIGDVYDGEWGEGKRNYLERDGTIGEGPP